MDYVYQRAGCFVIITIFVVRSKSNTQNIKSNSTVIIILAVDESMLWFCVYRLKIRNWLLLWVFFWGSGYHTCMYWAGHPHPHSVSFIGRSMKKFWICSAHDLHPLSRHDHQYMTCITALDVFSLHTHSAHLPSTHDKRTHTLGAMFHSIYHQKSHNFGRFWK